MRLFFQATFLNKKPASCIRDLVALVHRVTHDFACCQVLLRSVDNGISRPAIVETEHGEKPSSLG
jgi:hypothetical protein